MAKKIILVLGAVSILLSVILFSCAKEAMPQGGPRDTIPPEVVWSKPPQFATNFNEKEIVIKFNEYFELKDINNNFFSSPPFAKQPKFVINGKKLIVRFRDTLRDSVTYTLEFGDAIVDFHEGNVLKNFKFVFSTYDRIDTLRITGKVVDAKTLEPVSGISVMLYHDYDDSVVFSHPPQYATRTNDSGEFVIFGIKKDKYKVFALEDLNNNFIYDGIENRIAFLDSLVEPSVRIDTIVDTVKLQEIIKDTVNGTTDTVFRDSIYSKRVAIYSPYLILRVFQENTRPQQVVASERQYPFLVKIRFNLPLIDNYYKISLLKPKLTDTAVFVSQYFYDSDSLFIWLTDSTLQHQDTLRFKFEFYTPVKNGRQIVYDTVEVTYPRDTAINVTWQPVSDKINHFDSLVLITNVYQNRIDTTRWELTEVSDTLTHNPRLVRATCLRTNPNVITVLFSRPVEERFIRTLVLNDPSAKLQNRYDSTTNILTVRLPGHLARLDTVYFYLMYRVKRYYGYYDPFVCEKALLLVRQDIEKIIWKDPKLLVLQFAKPVQMFSLTDLDTEKVEINRRVVKIWLKQFQDQLNFKVKTLDFTDLAVHPIYFEKQVKIKYEWKPDKPVKVARPSRDTVKILFSGPLDSVASIICPDVRQANAFDFSISGDTLIVRVLNKKLKQIKFFDLIINYFDKNGDSLAALSDTVRTEFGNDPFLVKTQVLKPVSLNKIVRDTADYLRYYVYAPYKAGKKYLLFLYPGAYQAVDRSQNDTLIPISFSTTSTEDYGTLKLIITDSSGVTDSSNLILELIKDKNIIRKTSTTGKDPVIFDKLAAGNYTLKIIIDANKNGRWDTGNYLRDEQPEQVVIYPKKLMVKPKWEVEEHIYIK